MNLRLSQELDMIWHSLEERIASEDGLPILWHGGTALTDRPCHLSGEYPKVIWRILEKGLAC